MSGWQPPMGVPKGIGPAIYRPTLLVHGFHTDCSECGNSKLSPRSMSCAQCGAVFTHVETRCLYKCGLSELSMTIGEWQDRGSEI